MLKSRSLKNAGRLTRDNIGIRDFTLLINAKFDNDLTDIFVTLCFWRIAQWAGSDQVALHLFYTSGSLDYPCIGGEDILRVSNRGAK